MRVGLLVLVVALLALTQARLARADEVAPNLEGADLRIEAQSELRRLVSAMPEGDRKRLVGVYVAFDPSTTDPIAQVACDDDGDYVVVLSDAMLRLAAHVARADSYDESSSSQKVEEYAAFVARAQTPGRRLLPPPPGFFLGDGRASAEKSAATYEARLDDVLSFIVAHELTRLRAGDLVCPKPTATKESGDDLWTRAEQQKASETALELYPGRQLERDNEAIVRVLEGGRSEKGALALMRFFAKLDTERGIAIARFSPTYSAHHPGSSLRLANLKRVIATR